MSANQLDVLLSALLGAPALPGARCRGRSHLFDPRGDNESLEVTEQRHDQAIGLCRLCPALASCSTWFDGLPRAKRPPGVVAGQLHPKTAGRPAGANRKDQSA